MNGRLSHWISEALSRVYCGRHEHVHVAKSRTAAPRAGSVSIMRSLYASTNAAADIFILRWFLSSRTTYRLWCQLTNWRHPFATAHCKRSSPSINISRSTTPPCPCYPPNRSLHRSCGNAPAAYSPSLIHHSGSLETYAWVHTPLVVIITLQSVNRIQCVELFW